MAGEGVEFELRIRSDFVPQKFVHRGKICPSARRKILQHNELSWSDPILLQKCQIAEAKNWRCSVSVEREGSSGTTVWTFSAVR